MNLLIGATGFVGGHLVEYLFQQGEISKGIFRKGSHLKILDTNGVQGFEADLLDHHSLHEAMEGVDVVYDLASPMPDSDSDFGKADQEGLRNILEVASEAKTKTLVYLSTLDVYGFGAGTITESLALRPAGVYQKSKAESERILGEFSKSNQTPRVVKIRAAKAVGSRDETVVVPILRSLKSGKVLLPGDRRMSFSHPVDVAQAMYKAALGGSISGSTYLVKSFDATPQELAAAIADSAGLRGDVKKQGLLGGSPFPKYAAEQLRAALRIDDQLNWSEIGYVPQFSLASTAAEVAKWYAKEPWVTDPQ